jgi:hypothetical protein
MLTVMELWNKGKNMEKESTKKPRSLNVEDEVWEAWMSLAASMGISASAMFELVARVIINAQGQGGFNALLSMAAEIGKEAGKEFKKEAAKKGVKKK